MKSTTRLVWLTLGAMFASTAAIAQDTSSGSSRPMVYVKDSVITTKIKAKLGEDKMNSLLHVSVDTDAHGIVVLSGTVKSSEQEARAVSIAKGTEGVTSVTDNLTIKRDE